MKLSTLSILCTASLLLLSGCVSPEPTPQQKAVTDASLPVVTLTKNGIIRDMKTVAFEWKSIQDPRVSAVYVYKRDFSNKDSKKLDYLTTIDNRFQTHFVDSSNCPDGKYSYAFRVISKDAKGELSRVYIVNTLPVLQSVAWIHSIAGLPRMAKIIWRPHSNQLVKSYILERKTLAEDEWDDIATIKGRLNAEYIDAELKDNFVYKYRLKVKTYTGMTSKPSAIVKVVTKSLPKQLENITATKNLPKKIKINWEKTQNKDFIHYNVYRSKEIDGSYDLMIETKINEYIDDIDEDGKNYFYRVSTIDKDRLESKHEVKSVHGKTLAKPLTPSLVGAKMVDNHLEISWSSKDTRVESYIVTKKAKKVGLTVKQKSLLI